METREARDSRNALTGICALKADACTPGRGRAATDCRNALTGICALKVVVSGHDWVAVVQRRNALTGICALKVLGWHGGDWLAHIDTGRNALTGICALKGIDTRTQCIWT